MNIEETDYVEIVERCNLKTGINTVFSGGVVLRTSELSSDEIYEKYKDYLTKDQIRNLYRKDPNCIYCFGPETCPLKLDFNRINDQTSLAKVLEELSDAINKELEGMVKLEYVTPLSYDTLLKMGNYFGGIDPYKCDSTLCDVQIFKNESRH